MLGDNNLSYIKSCLNYTGGKYRLLNQIFPLFPKDIACFIDLFCGGANVAINSIAPQIICNDIDTRLIQLFKFLQSNSIENTFKQLNSIIEFYGLSRSVDLGYEFYGTNSRDGLSSFNKEAYNNLKSDYNNHLYNSFYVELLFYILIVYGFNNQIRYNKNNCFNIPVGKRDFNQNLQKKLHVFIENIQNKNITFYNNNFCQFDIPIKKETFVYIDPPYLITTASYNEQNKWTENEEIQLLNYIDELDKQNIKFALSNVFEMNNIENEILKKWSEKYATHYLDFHYNNSNYQKKNTGKTQEVLICNY